MLIRTATPDDSGEICALIRGLIGPILTTPDGRGADAFLRSISEASIHACIESPDYLYLVAVSGTQVFGAMALRSNRHIHHLFVSPDYQRRGIATQLWSTAKRHATRQGHVGRFTVNASIGAIPVYERLLFVADGAPVVGAGISYQPMSLEEPVV